MELNSTHTALPTTSALWKNLWVRRSFGSCQSTSILTSAWMFTNDSNSFHLSSLFSRRLGQHGILVLGSVDGNDEGRVAVGIFVVELEDDFNIRPNVGDLAFQSRAPLDKRLR
ncbi:hypothetical protein J6590_086721 [Homalodisca vitripennis]|nr:hypothetical protein J6590_086721 [Homalodisca vitripennis]